MSAYFPVRLIRGQLPPVLLASSSFAKLREDAVAKFTQFFYLASTHISSFKFEPITPPFGFYYHFPSYAERPRCLVTDEVSFHNFLEFHQEEALYMFRGTEPESPSPPSSPPHRPQASDISSSSSQGREKVPPNVAKLVRKRDHNRCCFFGFKGVGGDLEILHIYPATLSYSEPMPQFISSRSDSRNLFLGFAEFNTYFDYGHIDVDSNFIIHVTTDLNNKRPDIAVLDGKPLLRPGDISRDSHTQLPLTDGNNHSADLNQFPQGEMFSWHKEFVQRKLSRPSCQCGCDLRKCMLSGEAMVQ